MTRGKLFICVVALAAFAGGLLASPAQGATTKFTSCTQMHKTFKYGIAVGAPSALSAVRLGFRRPAVRTNIYYASSERLDPQGTGVMCGVKVRRQPTVTVQPAVDIENYVGPTAPGAPASECQVTDQSSERRQYGSSGLASGFPRPVEYLNRPGVIRMALIPVDWADLPGEPNPLSRVTDQMKAFSDWYALVSEGRIKVEWVPYDGWVRLPGASGDYSIPYSTSYGTQAEKFKNTAYSSADAVFDFSGVDVANFILPSGQTVLGEGTQGFPYVPDEAFQTREGVVRGYTAPGQFFDAVDPGGNKFRAYWTYWAHEVGHMLGIAHVGSSHARSDMQGFELMGDQGGPFRTNGAWIRYVKGWLNDGQVYCQTVASLVPTTVMLNPIDNLTPGIKAAMVRISDTKLLVVESRRTPLIPCQTEARTEGVLAYTYDATKGNQEVWLQPIYPSGRGQYGSNCGSGTVDALLREGDSVTVDGVRVAVLKNGRFDTVSLAPA